MKKVIILNAPPRAGKDTAAKFLAEKLSCKIMSFKQPLHEITARLLNIPLEDYLKVYEDEKEQECIEIDNLVGYTKLIKPLSVGKLPVKKYYTLREFYIHLSENVMKPIFGKEVFGKIAAEKLVNGWNVFSDGGFEDEANSILYMEEDVKVYLIRLQRTGTDFKKDSRGYLENKIAYECCYNVSNNDTVVDFHNKLENICKLLK